MNGPIAQVAALTAYANAYVSGHDVSFDFKHSTSKFCNKIEFTDVHSTGARSKEKQTALNPDGWFKFLRGCGVTRVTLHYTGSGREDFSDRMSVLFVGGGGRWLMEASHGMRSDVWEARWKVTDEDNPEQNIWTVTYGLIVKDSESFDIQYHALEETYQDLEASLGQIRSFATGQGLDRFAQCFESGIQCLKSEQPLSKVYHKDIFPGTGYSQIARQLIAACQAAWVFGGTGSWNDVWFEGDTQKEYEQVSNRLFMAINMSIVAAVNSFQPPRD